MMARLLTLQHIYIYIYTHTRRKGTYDVLGGPVANKDLFPISCDILEGHSEHFNKDEDWMNAAPVSLHCESTFWTCF